MLTARVGRRNTVNVRSAMDWRSQIPPLLSYGNLARNASDRFGNANKDGGFNVIGANGFEKSAPASQK
jgi:hypothetical protein